ncbi:Pre-mRNA-splicing factor 18 [Cichlidogyrus casuarinus]|uniref:Pre-mRNA-splicing factor 18 n=1 Tax=Cichlidogyrus casuarinus TaxID=1844966 RepID=A0ABD2PYE7_9PLAT
MDILKAEIERKRKLLEENGVSIGCISLFPHKALNNKYIKRSELKKKEEEELMCKFGNKLAKSAKPQNEDETNGNRRLSIFEKLEKERIEKEKDHIMPKNEIVKFLRERNQPIKLFGESEYDTFQRLKRVQLLEPESVGLRNDLQAALEKVEGTGDEDLYKKRVDVGDLNDEKALNVEIRSEDLKEDDLTQMKKYLSDYVAKREGTFVGGMSKTKSQFETKEEEEAHEKKEMDLAASRTLIYLKSLLNLWGDKLNSRSKEVKLSYAGKMSSATYTQTLDYLRPLFRSLKRGTYQADIMDSLVKICVLLMDRNYIKANDAYLELAIGNAPWPLGVTNHGIHSRTAQEKIHAKNVAHVLNDEVQRKYIQAIKRIITRAQEFYPTDPSKCVNYMGHA